LHSKHTTLTDQIKPSKKENMGTTGRPKKPRSC